MTYSNSSLVSYTQLSPNNSGQRKSPIYIITPHCVVGQCTVQALGSRFSSRSVGASSNYGIGKDGQVGMYVEEKNRSQCSSSSQNDDRAVTIECASDNYTPYAFNDKCYATLINLCADICQRYGKKKLLQLGSLKATQSYQPKSDEMLLTVHRQFAPKSCPGDQMFARMGTLANQVTAKLSGSPVNPVPNPSPAPTPQPASPYIFNGLNYSPVFDPTFYSNKYPDLKAAFGNNATQLFQHFTTFGMKEARQAIYTFDPKIYRQRYADLNKAFGDNQPQYYQHYIQFGIKEGRKGY